MMNKALTVDGVRGLARSLLDGNRPSLGAMSPADIEAITREMAVIRLEEVTAELDAEEAKEAAMRKDAASSAAVANTGNVRPSRDTPEGMAMVQHMMRSEDLMLAFALLQAAGEAFKVGMAAAAATVSSTGTMRP